MEIIAFCLTRWSSFSQTEGHGRISCGDRKSTRLNSSHGALKLTAASPGAWAEDMRVTVSPASKAKTQVLSVSGADLTLKNADGFYPGDVVELYDGRTAAYATVKSVLDKVITLDAPCALDVADTRVGTSKYVRTCEITITARLGETVEVFENLSLKEGALNNVCARTRRSDLITVEVLETKTSAAPAKGKDKDKDKDEKEPAPAAAPALPAGSIVPFILCGGTEGELVLTLQGGSSGSVRTATPDAFLGKDDGPAGAPVSRPSRRTAMYPSWLFPASPRRRSRLPSSGSARGRRAALRSWMCPWS